MIAPLDETCLPSPTMVDETQTAPVMGAESNQPAFVLEEGKLDGTIVTSDLRNEDCPGSRSGDGCE